MAGQGSDLRATDSEGLPIYRKLLLTRDEAAELCGMHYKTFNRYVNRGSLPKATLGSGSGKKWSRLALEAYLNPGG